MINTGLFIEHLNLIEKLVKDYDDLHDKLRDENINITNNKIYPAAIHIIFSLFSTFAPEKYRDDFYDFLEWWYFEKMLLDPESKLYDKDDKEIVINDNVELAKFMFDVYEII